MQAELKFKVGEKVIYFISARIFIVEKITSLGARHKYQLRAYRPNPYKQNIVISEEKFLGEVPDGAEI